MLSSEYGKFKRVEACRSRFKQQGRNKNLRIGEVSRSYGISVDNLYYYINYGLLVPKKPKGQYDFDQQTLRDLDLILELKDMKFSLKEIHQVLSLYSCLLYTSLLQFAAPASGGHDYVPTILFYHRVILPVVYSFSLCRFLVYCVNLLNQMILQNSRQVFQPMAYR